MRCPRCETSVLDEREREGVTIDVCQSCRGIWLDRGELEKLITRERQWDDDRERDRDRGRERDRDSDDRLRARDRDSDERPRGLRDDDDRGYKHKRKKGFLDALGDIFD